jgi:5-methylcytosine-specific restriction endonuclease McrA
MTTSINRVAKLSEQELLAHFAELVARDRRTTAELLVAIAEIDERKLWATHACSSMFTFCMKRFHMSEQVTTKRLWAARTARRFPIILEMVARGELHLGAIHLLAKHLTAENHAQVLERARHKSCREVERLVAELAPRSDVPSRIRALPGHRAAGRTVDEPAVDEAAAVQGTSREELSTRSDVAGASNASPDSNLTSRAIDTRLLRTPESRAAKPIVALSPRRYKIEITVDEATHDKLRSLQDLMARTGTGRDPAAIISRAIDVLLVRTLVRKAGCTDQPKSKTPASDVAVAGRAQHSRTIPAAVRLEVWLRDSGRCRYEDRRGRRCGETSNVEFHHKHAFALGGPPTTENIELRCAAHNQLQADLDFGRSFMDAKRGDAAAA